MEKEEDYPWIRAWEDHMGAFQYYKSGRVAAARAEKAPQNAIYKRDGKWFTTDDIPSNRVRQALGLPLWPTRPMLRVEFIIPPENEESVRVALSKFDHSDLTFTWFNKEAID